MLFEQILLQATFSFDEEMYRKNLHCNDNKELGFPSMVNLWMRRLLI